jgi:hypothetical protein
MRQPPIAIVGDVNTQPPLDPSLADPAKAKAAADRHRRRPNSDGWRQCDEDLSQGVEKPLGAPPAAGDGAAHPSHFAHAIGHVHEVAGVEPARGGKKARISLQRAAQKFAAQPGRMVGRGGRNPALELAQQRQRRMRREPGGNANEHSP